MKSKFKVAYIVSLFILILSVCLLLSGCFNKSQPKDGKVHLRFVGWAGDLEIKLINGLIADFEKDNPNIKVKYIQSPPGAAYNASVLTMVAGGNPPDVMYVAPRYLGDFVQKGVLMNITPLMKKSKVLKESDFFPATIPPYRWDGKQYGKGNLYGLCKDWSANYLIFYNKKLFRESGIPYPDGTWTREEFVEIAKKLTKRDSNGKVEQWGLNNNCAPEQWAWQSGGAFFDKDGKETFLTTKETLRGLQFAADLCTKYKVAESSNEGAMNNSVVKSSFESGRIAMCFFGMWMVPQFRVNIKDFDWSVTLPPKDKKEIYYAEGMNGYGICSKTKHVKEAWKFLEYLEGPKGQLEVAKVGWNIPGSKKAAYSNYFLKNPVFTQEIVDAFLGAAEKTEFVDRSPHIGLAEFEQYFKPQWDLAITGNKTVTQAMRDAKKQIDTAIKDNILIMEENR